MRQEMADHNGEVIERKAGGTTQGADHSALFLGGFPRQLVRPAGTILARVSPTFAPLADSLGADPEAAR